MDYLWKASEFGAGFLRWIGAGLLQQIEAGLLCWIEAGLLRQMVKEMQENCRSVWLENCSEARPAVLWQESGKWYGGRNGMGAESGVREEK